MRFSPNHCSLCLVTVSYYRSLTGDNMVFCKLFKLPVCLYLVLSCSDIAFLCVILEMLVGWSFVSVTRELKFPIQTNFYAFQVTRAFNFNISPCLALETFFFFIQYPHKIHY